MKKSRVALIGSEGMLAGIVQRFASETHQTVSFDLPDFDVTDRYAVLRTTISQFRPDVVLKCCALAGSRKLGTIPCLAAKDSPSFLFRVSL